MSNDDSVRSLLRDGPAAWRVRDWQTLYRSRTKEDLHAAVATFSMEHVRTGYVVGPVIWLKNDWGDATLLQALSLHLTTGPVAQSLEALASSLARRRGHRGRCSH